MTVFTDKAIKYIPRLQKDLALKDFQASGMFGNIGTETGGFKYSQEIKPVVANSRGGLGWFMWTGPRRVKYENWCKAKNWDVLADESNYQYVVHETMIDEAHSLAQLKKTTTLEAATETFMKQNLRPGVPNLASRQKYALDAFNAIKASSVVVSLPTPTVDPPIKSQPSITNKEGGALVGTVGTLGLLATQWPYIILGIAIIATSGYVYYKYRQYKKIATK